MTGVEEGPGYPSAPGYWYIVLPAVTLIAAAPFALAVVEAPFGPVPYYFLPFWIGVLCSPGYIAAWNSLRQRSELSSGMRALALVSIVASIGCSVAGAMFSAFTIIGGLLSVGSGIMASTLLFRFWRAKHAAPHLADHSSN